MRRGIGVGHIVQKKQHKDNMADLGAMMSAERIARFADQLDDLKQRLKELTLTHLHEIEGDAIVQAKFRQLADSLGVDFGDLLRGAAEEHQYKLNAEKHRHGGAAQGGDTSTKLFEKILSMIDGSAVDRERQEILRLGCEAIQACILERRYVGAFVPLTTVVQQLRRKYKANNIPFHLGKGSSGNATASSLASSSTSHAATTLSSDAAAISDIIVRDALRLVTDVLGVLSGYGCIEMDGVVYVQAVAGGSTGAATDTLKLLSAARRVQVTALTATTSAGPSPRQPVSTAPPSAHGSVTSRVGAASVLPSTWRRAAEAGADAHEQQQQLTWSCTKAELHAELPHWPVHRLDATLGGLMSDGSVWIDQPTKAADVRYWFLQDIGGMLINT